MSAATVLDLLGTTRVVGWAVLHAAWQTALVTLALHATLVLLPGDSTRARARVCAFAILASWGLLLGSLLASGIDWRSHVGCWTPAPPPGAAIACAEHGLPRGATVGSPRAPRSFSSAFLAGRDPARDPGDPVLVAARRLAPLMGLLGITWIGWLVGLSVRTPAGLLRLRGVHRRATPLRDPRLQHLLPALQATMGVRKHVRILESFSVTSPCLLPGPDARIVLPTGLASTLTEHELRAALAHELAHVRRHDGLIAPLFTVLARGLPPPASRRLDASLRHEREADCDRATLEAAGVSAALYGRILLVLEGFRANRSMSDSVLSMVGGSGLTPRFRRLMESAAHKRPPLLRRVAAAALLVGSIALLAASVRPAYALTGWSVMSQDLDGRSALPRATAIH